MKKKIVAIFLVILLVNFSAYSVFAETKSEVNQKITDTKSDIDKVQTEKKSVLQEIDELDTSIAKIETELVLLNQKITDLNEDITKKNKEIKEKEDEYDEKNKLFKDRLVALYKAGDTSYLDILLSSANITDFISNYYLIEQIAECDTKMLNSIETAKNSLETAKKDLEDKKEEINKTKKEVSSKNTQLKNDKASKEAKVAGLNEEEKELQLKLDAYNAEMAKIQKAEAEEAARQQALAKQQAAGNSNSSLAGQTSVVSGTGQFTWPIPGYTTLTSYFGYRDHPIYHTWTLHSGIDVGAPTGANFVAADDGTVIFAQYGYNGGYGNYVVISHGNGLTSRYAHGTSILVSEGQKVTKGTPVLTVGSTGASTGPHAHFEVRVNGVAVDPMNYL